MRAALLVLLLATPSRDAAPLQHLVFSGGTDRAAGDAALASWKRLAPLVEPHVRLPTGFPKLVESGSLPGLKPGFFVVVLGLCDDLSAFDVVKALYPGAYAKPAAEAPESSRACPTRVGAAEVTHEEGSLKTPAGVVSGASASTSADDERGFAAEEASYALVLVHPKTGVVLDTLTLAGSSRSTSVGGGPAPEETACSATLEWAKRQVQVTRTCRTDARACFKEPWIRTRWTERDVVTVVDARLVSRSTETVDEKAECRSDWGEQGD
jgi:hypothetical protein